MLLKHLYDCTFYSYTPMFIVRKCKKKKSVNFPKKTIGGTQLIYLKSLFVRK